MFRRAFRLLCALVPFTMLLLAAPSARSGTPAAAVIVTGKTVQILDGDGNFFTTEAFVVRTQDGQGVISWHASLSGVPNSTGRRVHWTGPKTGIACIIDTVSVCNWKVTVSPSGHAVLVGITDPTIEDNRPGPRQFIGLK